MNNGNGIIALRQNSANHRQHSNHMPPLMRNGVDNMGHPSLMGMMPPRQDMHNGVMYGVADDGQGVSPQVLMPPPPRDFLVTRSTRTLGSPYPIPLPSTSLNQTPVYVNVKQYRRILKRRAPRAALAKRRKVVKTDTKYRHRSRHLHAKNRRRGVSGRFLKKDAPSTATPPAQINPPTPAVNETTAAAKANGATM